MMKQLDFIEINPMVLKKNKLFFVLSILMMASSVLAQSMQILQAKIRSMEACRQSLKHSECNLKILDKEIQDSLIQLDRLQQLSSNLQVQNRVESIASGAIQFASTSISEVNGEIIKMIGGSTWRLNRNYLGLSLSDVIIVMSDSKNGVIYSQDNSYGARLLSGSVSTSTGQIRTVMEKIGEGSILKLDDGTLLEFSSYDKYDSGWWLPPYRVILDSSRMNMWNLEKGKKVWVQRVLN